MVYVTGTCLSNHCVSHPFDLTRKYTCIHAIISLKFNTTAHICVCTEIFECTLHELS